MTGSNYFRDATTAILGLVGPAIAAAQTEVIYTEIRGHPTAVVPGMTDPNGLPAFAEFTSMRDLISSPDGKQWIIRVFVSYGASTVIDALLFGSGTNGGVIIQEDRGIPNGGPGEVVDFATDSMGFNAMGQYAITVRAKGGDASVTQKVLMFDGSQTTIVHQMGDLLTDLVDLAPNPSGDERFGNEIGSTQLLNDGRVALQDFAIQNIHSNRRPALFFDRAAFKQAGMDTIGGEAWQGFRLHWFRVTPDGLSWATLGDTANDNTDIDGVFVVNDVIEYREATTLIPGSIQASPVDDVFAYQLLPNGEWLARGDYDNAAADDWATRNGVLLAEMNATITPTLTEKWATSLDTVTGNTDGDSVVMGGTDNADANRNRVAVLNGQSVIQREGDMVDLNGNGLADDDAFISNFHANDAFFTNGDVLYFFATLRDGAGTALGDAFLRLSLNGTLCPNDPSGTDCETDLDGDCAIGNVELEGLLDTWGLRSGDPNFDPDVDHDGDGAIGNGDLQAILDDWANNCQ